jgi:hypothetical protein
MVAPSQIAGLDHQLGCFPEPRCHVFSVCGSPSSLSPWPLPPYSCSAIIAIRFQVALRNYPPYPRPCPLPVLFAARHCHDSGQAHIASAICYHFFGTHRAAELRVSRSRTCKAACKGVRSVPMEYIESRRAEDQEAGPVGAPGSGQCGRGAKAPQQVKYQP